MNEQDARARMVADITASVQADNTHLVNIVQIYKLLGFDPIQIDGDSLEYPVGAKFRRDWAAGVPAGVMSAELGVSDPTVARWARNAGLPKRQIGPNCRTVEAGPAFRAAWLGGVPTVKMADALGVSGTTIRRVAEAAGLPRRSVGNTQNIFKGAAE